MVFIVELFLWMFCKNILIFFKIMLSITHIWADWVVLVFTNFLIFFAMLLPIKTVTPKGAGVQAGLVIVFAVYTLEGVRAWFILFCFKMQRIGLENSFAVPSEMMMVFRFVWSIAFNTSWPLEVAWERCMFLLPAIFVLRYAWIHIGFFDSSNETSYVKASVDDFFGRWTILQVPYVDSYNGHVRFQGNFAYARFENNFDIIENVGSFDYTFHYIRINERSVCIFNEIENSQNLEIRFGLGKLSVLNISNI